MRKRLSTLLVLTPLCLAAKSPGDAGQPLSATSPAQLGLVEVSRAVEVLPEPVPALALLAIVVREENGVPEPCLRAAPEAAARNRFTLSEAWAVPCASVDSAVRDELAGTSAWRDGATDLQPFLEVETLYDDERSLRDESYLRFGVTGSIRERHAWRVGLQYSGESEYYGDGIQNEDAIAIGVGLSL